MKNLRAGCDTVLSCRGFARVLHTVDCSLGFESTTRAEVPTPAPLVRQGNSRYSVRRNNRVCRLSSCISLRLGSELPMMTS
jgi:hypothetical protein